MGALSSEQRKLLERATLQYAEHLDEAKEYLESERGIDLEYARSSALGVVRDPVPGHEHLEGRLSIPYLTDYGPVNMTFRCMKDHACKEVGCAKYMRFKGTPTTLYGVQSIARADDWIAVTEGEIDAITLNMIGIPALGVPGTENWQEHWPNVLDDFSRIYVFTDGDNAGDILWKNVSHHMNTAIRVAMPHGEDVNSMYNREGYKYLRGRIRK